MQTISAEYCPVNRDAAYWMVGAYMAPLLDLGYSPRVAQQKLQGSGVYMRISGPPYKGGAQPLDIYFHRTRPPSVGGSLPRHYRYKVQLDGAMLQCMCFIMLNIAWCFVIDDDERCSQKRVVG